MITAENAKKNAKTFEENRYQTITANLDEWMETVLSVTVATASEQGRYSVWEETFKKYATCGECRTYICNKLVALGYIVNVLPSGSLEVCWY